MDRNGNNEKYLFLPILLSNSTIFFLVWLSGEWEWSSFLGKMTFQWEYKGLCE